MGMQGGHLSHPHVTGHNVHLMGLGGLFYPVCIVCGGSKPNSLVFIQTILIDDNAVAILMCELVFIPVVGCSFDACQQMIDKTGPEAQWEVCI
jgi:hypothetical protein